MDHERGSRNEGKATQQQHNDESKSDEHCAIIVFFWSTQ
jgi:hypothetical protein